jgi:hypothetical protein
MLKSILEGKKVALVAPGAQTEIMSLGSLIDSYDIVARVGNLAPLVKDEVGSRTDILCENFWFWSDKYSIDKAGLYNQWLSEGVKYVNYIWPDSHGLLEFRKLNNDRLPISYQPFDVQLKIRDVVGSPTKGMCAIYDFLQYPIAELFVVGYSFCKGFGYRKDYFLNTFNVPTGEVEYINPLDSMKDLSKWTVNLKGYDHKLREELDWFKSIKDSRLKCDPWLEKLLCE